MDTELLIKNGRVIDPANNIDHKCDVLVADGKVAKVGKVEKSTLSIRVLYMILFNIPLFTPLHI